MRMGTLEGKVKEIEIQPELKPGSSECRLALLQVLGHRMYCGRFELKFIVRLIQSSFITWHFSHEQKGMLVLLQQLFCSDELL